MKERQWTKKADECSSSGDDPTLSLALPSLLPSRLLTEVIALVLKLADFELSDRPRLAAESLRACCVDEICEFLERFEFPSEGVRPTSSSVSQIPLTASCGRAASIAPIWPTLAGRMNNFRRILSNFCSRSREILKLVSVGTIGFGTTQVV